MLRSSWWLQDFEDGGVKGHTWVVRGITNILRALALHCPNIKEFHLGSEASHVPTSIVYDVTSNVEDVCP